MFLALVLKIRLVCHKDRYWAHFFLIYSLTIYFYFSTRIVTYATMLNSLYAIERNPENIKALLTKTFKQLTTWFCENFMILNPQKCHFMSLGTCLLVTKR